ncbi:hypothetical protein QAD02_009547 [Eretmocerus hayati]|uniref:Uncharacterized protein n=1 Tax=Eretmocerus hayati TaxID=131215 RepID=A0ACC2N9J1_9HYME|nr:hypothetical protein QAD02_009547 [Eretmocerus hayati]
MSHKSSRNKACNIKVEPNMDDESNRAKRINTRGQSNTVSNAKVDAIKISPTQLKQLPKILSNIVVQGPKKIQELIITNPASPNTFMTDESYKLETCSTIPPIPHQESIPEHNDDGDNDIPQMILGNEDDEVTIAPIQQDPESDDGNVKGLANKQGSISTSAADDVQLVQNITSEKYVCSDDYNEW